MLSRPKKLTLGSQMCALQGYMLHSQCNKEFLPNELHHWSSWGNSH